MGKLFWVWFWIMFFVYTISFLGFGSWLETIGVINPTKWGGFLISIVIMLLAYIFDRINESRKRRE